MKINTEHIRPGDVLLVNSDLGLSGPPVVTRRPYRTETGPLAFDVGGRPMAVELGRLDVDRSPWIEVDSSMIQAIRFRSDATGQVGQLGVRFNTGAVYVYTSVPAFAFAALVRAAGAPEGSVGKVFNTRVRGRFTYSREE